MSQRPLSSRSRPASASAPKAPHSSLTKSSATKGSPTINFATKTAMDEKYVDQAWDFLSDAIKQIQRKTNGSLSYEELYRRAYTMVLHKQGKKLYTNLQAVLEEHMAYVREAAEMAEAGRLIPVILELWQDHTLAMGMIRDICLYVDRIYVPNNRVPSVYALGMACFRKDLIHYSDIAGRICREVLKTIRSERDGGLIDWLSLQKTCEMLYAIDVYEEDFEEPFLEETAEYYKKLGLDLISSNPSTIYVAQVEKIISDETMRAHRCFKGFTKDRVLEVIDDEMIKTHLKTIIEKEGSGVTYLLDDYSLMNTNAGDRLTELSKLYGLLARVDGGHMSLCKNVTDWIRQMGGHLSDPALQSDEIKNSPILYISSMIKLKGQADELIKKAFVEDSSFKNKIYSEFEVFVNKNENAAEYLAVYLDEKLKAVRTLNENDVDLAICGVMELFRFLSNKDIFEHFYKRFLARRFLSERGISEDLEKRMLNRLRIECGYQYTQKLDQMFKDRELWSTLQDSYSEFMHDTNMRADTLDIHVRVLNCGVWPQATLVHCHLPVEAEHAFLTFNEFYVRRHNGRKLSLNSYMGSAEVKASFFNPVKNTNSDISLVESSTMDTTTDLSLPRIEVQKILAVSTHQMAVLMLFNKKDAYSFDEMLETMMIPEPELTRVLQSLSMGKVSQRVLVRKSNGQANSTEAATLCSSDVFFVNDLFTSKLTRVKIAMVTESKRNQTIRMPREDRERVQEHTIEDRKHEIECAVVRIMKSRKKLDHNNLLSEVIAQVSPRFQPTPLMVKQRIEALIERDYIAREKDNERIYNYVS